MHWAVSVFSRMLSHRSTKCTQITIENYYVTHHYEAIQRLGIANVYILLRWLKTFQVKLSSTEVQMENRVKNHTERRDPDCFYGRS